MGTPNRNILEIEWLSDTHNCEVCGPSFSEGAIVRLNNAVILEMIPQASCYSSETYDVTEVYDSVFDLMGVDVVHSENSSHPPYVEEDDDSDDIQ